MPTDTRICDICSEATTHDQCLLACTCGMIWCNSCIRDRFLLATKDMIHMPPTCCGSTIIGLHYALPRLSEEEAAAFRARFDEWRSPLKFYCPTPDCSAFVADTLLDSLDNDQYEAILSRPVSSTDPHTSADATTQSQQPPTVACPKCPNSICLVCKQSSHTGQCSDLVEQSTATLLRQMGYKRCPGCGTGVKRMWGCSHILCVCGTSWCWVCERPDYYCDGGGACDGAQSDGPDDLRDNSSDTGTDEDEDEEGDEDEDEEEDDKAVNLDDKAVTEASDRNDHSRDPLPTTAELSEEQQNVDKVIVSDRNDALEEGRDFGEEPGENAGLSCCNHLFMPLSSSEIEYDYSSLECHRCWTEIRSNVDKCAQEPVRTHKTRVKRFSQATNVFSRPKKEALKCACCHIMFCPDCTSIWKRRQDLRASMAYSSD